MFISTKRFQHPNKTIAVLDWTLSALFVAWTIRKLKRARS